MQFTAQRKPFLPVLETEEQYDEWEMNCMIELKRTRTWEFVDPSEDSSLKPTVNSEGSSPLVTAADVKAWNTNNDAAVGIIRTTISIELNRLVSKKSIAREIWSFLFSEFGDRAEEQAHLVHTQLVNLRLQEHGNVELFFKEFDLKKTRLAAMGDKYVVTPEQALLYLKGALPLSHQMSTLRIFNSNPDPTKKTYAQLRHTLLREASVLHDIETANEAKAFLSNSKPTPSASSSRFPSSNSSTSQMFLFTQNGVLYTNKGDKVDCRICGENHTARDCTKKSDDYQDLSAATSQPPRQKSPEAKLKEKAKRKASSEKKKALLAEAKILLAAAAAESESDDGEKSGVSFIGAQSSTILALKSAKNAPKVFVTDTGSDSHAVDDLDLLVDPVPTSVQIEGIVEGTFLSAKTKGTVILQKTKDRPQIALRDVLYSEQTSANIISLQKLADKGATIVLRPGGGQIVTSGQVTVSSSASTIPIDRKVGGFWTITDVSLTNSIIASSNDHSSTSSPFDALPSRNICLARTKQRVGFRRWHTRVCHPGGTRLSDTITKDVVDGLEIEGKIPHDLRCACCIKFKITKAPHTGDWLRWLAKKPLERIWLDLSGKSTPTFDGELYMLIIIDECTRHAWIRLLKKKSDSFDAFVEWHRKAERRSGYKLLEIGGDLGGEFIGKKWNSYTNGLGIDRWHSNSRTPKENPFVEREMRVTKECGEAALLHSGLPLACWGRVMQYAIWCRGRLARKSTEGNKTSYESFYKVRPSVAQAVAPGTIGWAYINKEDRENPNYGTVKALECRAMTVAHGSLGWTVLLKKGGEYTSSNVVWWENDDDLLPSFPPPIRAPLPIAADNVPVQPLPPPPT
ncbi:hypothetical protein P7C70_g8636, partial [Phenoliferia sp. Uapishka_3]